VELDEEPPRQHEKEEQKEDGQERQHHSERVRRRPDAAVFPGRALLKHGSMKTFGVGEGV